MDLGQVRVYLKNTIMREYAAQERAGAELPFRVLGIDPATRCPKTYVKPHGRLLEDGRIICWGRADGWKSIVTALYERSYVKEGSRPFAAVLTQAVERYRDDQARAMIENAATRLGIERIVWLET